VRAHIEYRGDMDSFGQPLLRLVVGDEYICFTADGAARFAVELAAASVALEGAAGGVS
jgi:hypothetical protein